MSEKKLFHEIPKAADFHSVVMTTYSFDFHHFESQVLRPLKSKGITNVNIFADTVMLDQSIGFSTGHLKSLSTSYSINAIPCVGAFHPKITILAGENDVLLLQGSGNITNGGHGKNHEVFSVFYANSDDQNQLPIIQEAWNYVRSLTNRIEGLSADKLNWVSDNCNLLNESPASNHQFYQISENFSAALVYNEQTSIWEQLIQLVPEDGIKNIKIFSPFYDEKGTFLKQLAQQYSRSQILAFLQPDKGIHPHKMDSLENMSFLSWESTLRAKARTAKFDRKLHSKIIWFDAGEVQYGLFGSPNATIKAFGTENNRGANDEFAVLIKVKDQKIIEELQLTGEFESWSPQEITNVQSIEEDTEQEQSKNLRKIKILGVDQDGKRITCFLQDSADYKKAQVVFYDTWGEELERLSCSLNSKKIRLELNEQKNIRALTFIQLINEEDDIISNKQIINKLHDLWNTNPSKENRRLMKLGSMLESGDSKLFDVINYFNDIQSERRKFTAKTTRGSSNDDKDEKLVAVISYEEAIALSKEEEVHQHIFKQHSSIKIWDAIEHYFNDLAVAEEEEDMDDEEEGEATTSRERKDKKPRTEPVILNSEKVLHSRRKAINKFLNNYLVGLKKSYQQENYKLGLIDMAMFLIVMKHLIEFTEREIVFKVESDVDEKDVLFPLAGNLSELTSFSGAMLNLVGQFVNILNISDFLQVEDQYISTKLSHYKTLVKRTSLFGLALIRENYKHHEKGSRWADLLALNIISKLGKLEQGYERHLEEFIKNTSIQKKETTVLSAYIEEWMQSADALDDIDDFHVSKDLGICEIIKKIPLTEPVKFLKLGRPGFEYNDEAQDFILQKLYNCKTGKLQSSLQKFKKNKLLNKTN
ncbi:hypothetical protein [Gelidibacter japonicus]|uniref:hypothetical protein n=1 Tax=Gelidibacter japonicus TaxID=1962232 RepID=UPI003A8EE1C9